MNDYLLYLKTSLKTNNIKAAKKLISELNSKDKQIKLKAFDMLKHASDSTTFELLCFLACKEHKDPVIIDQLIQLISRPFINFVFTMLKNGNRQTINQSIPLVRYILYKKKDKQDLQQIIKLIGIIKMDDLVNDIAEFIFYDDKHLKAEAVKALERISTSNAYARLIQASKTKKCDQDILDSIQMLSIRRMAKKIASIIEKKDPSQNDIIRYFTKLASKDFKKQFEALTTISQNSSSFAVYFPQYFEIDNHDLKINLLQLIKKSIPLFPVDSVFDIIHQKKTESLVKFAAYNALESFPELNRTESIACGLSESALCVRIAAIQVLEKNLSESVFSQIKSKIESGTKEGQKLAENILDARAVQIIDRLMISDTFCFIASNYLEQTASLPLLDIFISVLEKKNLKATAQKYIDIRKNKMDQKKKTVIVISSCEANLNTYNKQISACGFFPQMFEQPQDVFESIALEKPAAIICDLFLNENTGFDIAREIRVRYIKEDVPFIISSYQKNLDEILLHEEMESAGVNEICRFPAKTSQIKSWVNKRL
ncbi:MAG: hypothetical protein ABIJ59_20380 [Pseudomonadota bacterium]